MTTAQTHGTKQTATTSQTVAQHAAPQRRACAMPAFMSSQHDAGHTRKHDALSGIISH